MYGDGDDKGCRGTAGWRMAVFGAGQGMPEYGDKGNVAFHGRLDAAAMKESFARLLGYYPHLCGRVMRGEAVACDNSGVPFAVDEAPRCRLEQAVLMPDAPKRFGAHFDLSGFKRGRQAPLSVRLTRLADGTVLSLYGAHGCMDGDAFYTLVENWGRLHRGEPVVQPVADQSLLPQLATLSAEELLRSVKAAGWYPVGCGSSSRPSGLPRRVSAGAGRCPCTLVPVIWNS